MLWTDKDFVTTADLVSIDPDIESVAESQAITLEGNNSSIRRGVEDAGRFLEGVLVSFATYISSNDLSANHLSAVFYTGSQPNQRRRVTLEQIVISGRTPDYWSEIKSWAVNRVLMAVYLSASNRAEHDRYEDKLEMYRKRDVIELWPQLQKSGIPIVYRPMPAPGAVQARKPGAWVAGTEVLVGGTLAEDVDVAVSYVDGTKYLDQNTTNNAESNPSAVQTVTLTAGNGLTVDITGLNPPTGAVSPEMLSRGYTVPMNASGWNIWVGQKGGVLYLQNATPLPISQKTFDLAADPIFSGFPSTEGQWPDSFLATQNLIQRG